MQAGQMLSHDPLHTLAPPRYLRLTVLLPLLEQSLVRLVCATIRKSHPEKSPPDSEVGGESSIRFQENCNLK